MRYPVADTQAHQPGGTWERARLMQHRLRGIRSDSFCTGLLARNWSMDLQIRQNWPGRGRFSQLDPSVQLDPRRLSDF